MFVKLTCLCLLLAVAARAQEESAGVKIAYKIFDECMKSDGFVPCIKGKAIMFLDRVALVDSISVTDNINIVRDVSVPKKDIITESELSQSLPRALDARDEALDNMLVERVASLINSHKVTLGFPVVSADDLGRSIEEEGRGKKKKGGKKNKHMKKFMGMFMGGFALKMAALIPIAIAGLFLLAGKALITAKIALLLAVIIGIKKVLAAKAKVVEGGLGVLGGLGGGLAGLAGGLKGGHGGGHGGDYGGYHHDGYDRRSIEQQAQNLAYSGHVQVAQH